jgi:MFS superfamily sulfate permease-like transporter
MTDLTPQPESTDSSETTVSKAKHDLLASVVVFLVALPLCMGIAIASGAPVAAGLVTGIVGGLIAATLSGCPLGVSGPAAGLTVIVYDVIQRLGLEALGIVVLIAGALQILAGCVRAGQWFRAVSPAVIKGMLAGIGVLIFASQFHVMVDDKPKGGGLENLATIPEAVRKGLDMPTFQRREVRQFRTRMLKEVGELHREQAKMQERLIEHTERNGTEEKDGGIHIEGVAEYADRQKELTAKAESLLTELQQFERDVVDGERSGRIHDAALAALSSSKAAAETLDGEPKAEVFTAQQESVEAFENLLASMKNHSIAAQLGLLTILAILLWTGFVPRKFRVVPAPLIGVVLATGVAAFLMLPVLYVEVPERLLDELHFPTTAMLQHMHWNDVFMAAVLIAAVASAETLLCATAVDQMHNGSRTKYDRELVSQGVGNMVCGFLGALPMTAVIVRSSANIQAGARTRFSAILHSVWLLLFVVALSALLRMIPTASLAAILVYTGYKLVDFKSIGKLKEYGWGEVVIYAATVVTIVATDLLTGVLTGIALAAVKLLYTFSHLQTDLDLKFEGRKAMLRLEGAATFIRLPKLAAALERVPPRAELHVEFEHLNYIDHACLDLLMNWAKQHESTGGRLVIDWDSLHANFRGNGLANGVNGRRAGANENGHTRETSSSDALPESQRERVTAE